MVISTPVDQSDSLPGKVSSLWLLPLLVFQQRCNALASLICRYDLEYLGYILLVVCIGIASWKPPILDKQPLAVRYAVQRAHVAVADSVHTPCPVVGAGDGVSGGYLSAVAADRTVSGCMVGISDLPVVWRIGNAHSPLLSNGLTSYSVSQC